MFLSSHRSLNKQKKESMYSQSYPTNCTCQHVEGWEMYCLEAELASQIHMIMTFKNGSALIKCKDDMVYGVGDNCNGRLGLIENHYYRKPVKVDALCGKNIKTFYNSIDKKCIFAITEKGEVYGWGINDKHRLGKELENGHKPYMPFKMDGFQELCITQIACNDYNSLALTDSGKIYIWGNVDFKNNSSQHQPCQVTKLEKMKIVQIACGDSFVMALTNDGKLYSWGRNECNYYLGINSKNDICMYPCLITSLENVQIDKIVCGSKHSLALTSKGHIYSWGSNSVGQLGYDKECEKRKPTKLKWTANGKTMGIISDIAAQYNASAAVNKLGSVYVWGCLYYRIWKPIRIECSNIHNVFRICKTPHIIYRNIRERSNLMRHLETIFDDQLTSDLTIEVERKCIYVHKFVLIRCEYFKNMFQDDLGEARNNTIKCNDFPYNVYKVFLKYFYTDVVDHLSLEEAFELLKLCDKYMEETLAIKCMQMIEENINVSNIVLCFTKATECNAEYLLEYCGQFSSGQMSDIIKSGTLANLSKELLLDFISKTTNAWEP